METELFEFYRRTNIPARGSRSSTGTCLLTFLSSDSQAPCSLTWVDPDFHSIVPGLPFSAILFPAPNRKSCLQLFPAL